MTPVSDTAFYCCGVRTVDAERRRPICGDTYAHRFMDGRGREVFDRFRRFSGPNASNVARARLIDDLIRDDLASERDRQIVTVGAGFDARPFRLDGGRWVELDEPAVLALKDERLPVDECPRPLTRVPIQFEHESLASKLGPFAAEPRGKVTVVVEGVLMYLDAEAKRALLTTLAETFPEHIALADLMTKKFFDKYGARIHRRLAAMGASFRDMSDAPERAYVGLGFQQLGSWSTVEAAKRFGGLRIPWFMLRGVLKTLATEYRVHRFRAPG